MARLCGQRTGEPLAGAGERRQAVPRAQRRPRLGTRLPALRSLEGKPMQDHEGQGHLGKVDLESLADFEMDLILNYICTYFPAISFRKKMRENLLLECSLDPGQFILVPWLIFISVGWQLFK